MVNIASHLGAFVGFVGAHQGLILLALLALLCCAGFLWFVRACLAAVR